VNGSPRLLRRPGTTDQPSVRRSRQGTQIFEGTTTYAGKFLVATQPAYMCQALGCGNCPAPTPVSTEICTLASIAECVMAEMQEIARKVSRVAGARCGTLRGKRALLCLIRVAWLRG